MRAEQFHSRRAGVLVRYRVFGAPGVDQRLTVFENAAVELDERHRSRDPIWLRLEPAELETLRSALDDLPTRRRPHPAGLGVTRFLRTLGRTVLAVVWGRRGDAQRGFELRRGRSVISGDLHGEEVKEPQLAAVIEPLDALRVRAVRAGPR